LDADQFDLLRHVAYNAPRRRHLDRQDFFDRYAPGACAILNELLDKYAACI